MSEARQLEPVRSCVYCGSPIPKGRTCSAHRDLEQLDPSLQGERPAATDVEQGARDPRRIGRKAYRRELY